MLILSSHLKCYICLFWIESACQEEEDQERDQDSGKPARRDQHNPACGHSQRPGGRFASGKRQFVNFYPKGENLRNERTSVNAEC